MSSRMTSLEEHNSTDIPQKVSKSSVGQSPHVNTVDIGLFNQTSLSIIRKSVFSANICRLSTYDLKIISQLVRKKKEKWIGHLQQSSVSISLSYFVNDTLHRILSNSALVTESKLNSSVIEVTK